MPDIKSLANLASQFKILASVGHDLREFCSLFGIEIETVAQPMGIDIASFDDFEARISFQKFCQLLDVFASMSNEDAFGLRYALFSKRGATGPFGFGLTAAPNFKEMLGFYAKYVHIVVDIDSFNVTIEKDRFTIEWSYSPLISRTDQYADFAAVVGMRIFRQYSGGPVEPLYAQLRRSPPRDKSLHVKAFSKHLKFNAPINTFVFPASLLDFKNPSADKMMFKYWSEQCEAMIKDLRREKDIITAVKEDFIKNMEGRDVAVGDVARRNGLGERTLQRRLSDLGTGFWDLYEATRDEQSMRLLKDSELSFLEISHKLGYSSQSAYTRAVKRLHGKTPRQIRGAIRTT